MMKVWSNRLMLLLVTALSIINLVKNPGLLYFTQASLGTVVNILFVGYIAWTGLGTIIRNAYGEDAMESDTGLEGLVIFLILVQGAGAVVLAIIVGTNIVQSL